MRVVQGITKLIRERVGRTDIGYPYTTRIVSVQRGKLTKIESATFTFDDPPFLRDGDSIQFTVTVTVGEDTRV